MIRKFGAVEASPEEALEVMLDIEAWPEWMPNVVSTKVLERNDRRIVADVHRREHGRVHRTQLEFLVRPSGYTERQLAGLARKWEGEWRFRAAPEGRATVVSCKLDIDLGFFGIFVPRRTVQKVVDRTFDEILGSLESRASPGGSRSLGTASSSPLEDVGRVQVFETPIGLEIWLDDRKYIARRVE